MSDVRIATVKATGERFIVQRLYIAADAKDSKCFTWGQLTSYKGLASKHAPSKTFLLSAVEIKEVRKTPALLAELMEQHVKDLETRGAIVHRTCGGNYKVVGHRQVSP